MSPGKLWCLFTLIWIFQSCEKPLPQTPCDCAKEGILILQLLDHSSDENFKHQKEQELKDLIPICQKLIAEQGVCPYEKLEPYLSILSTGGFWTYGERVHDLILPHENLEPLWDTSEFDDSVKFFPRMNPDSIRKDSNRL